MGADIVDMTEDLGAFFPSENPYGQGPFKAKDRMCLLGRTDGGLYFVKFLPSVPPYKAQRWSVERADAKRFEDVRLAGEYGRFIDAMPDAPVGKHVIVWIDEANPNPLVTRKLHIQPVIPKKLTVGQYLTTYSGLR